MKKNLTKEGTRLQNIQPKKKNLTWHEIMNAKLLPWPIQGQNKYHYTLTVKEKGPRKKFSFKFPNVIYLKECKQL